MNAADDPSQTSDRSSVVDISCTYNISQSVLPQEPSPTSWEDDFCSTLTSASSLTSQNDTGSRKHCCDDNENPQLEEDEKSPIISQCSDAFLVTPQSATALNSSYRLETKQSLNDVQIRASLDALYEQSSWCGKNDTLSHQLSEKISDLSKKQHLYALRSFQLGKIVLNREGEKVLERCRSDNVFASREETKNVEPIPGLSNDVIRFIMDQPSPSHT
ncbi:shieldin complex subunit 1 [Leptodactylus fuscus]|uniref:shieldin complex subunit 1 n=1 Tax=Leptodactylus fuscus TaxID=238119 RepID=UPI003F4EB6A3